MLAFSLVMMAQDIPAQTYMHPKLVSREKTISSVALLPPTAQMRAFGFIGYDFKEKEAEQLASALAGVVSSALKKRGWQVNDSAFVGEALQSNEELRYLVGYLRARYQLLVDQIKPKDVSKGRYSLGERVAALNSQAPTDALVLVHADAERQTKAGTVAWTPILVWMGGPALAATAIAIRSTDVSLRISLVDSHTGEILCFTKVSSAEEEQILKELQKIL
jgi:ethanolamine utilization microcompartment shell protein EutS